MANPTVEMNVKDYGKIKIQLAPEQAPISVNNFLYLVKNGLTDLRSTGSLKAL